jgi:hypothetical protein
MPDSRSHALETLRQRRRAEFAELTGRVVWPLSENSARRIVEAFAAVGPPVMPAGATPSAAMTPEGITEMGAVRRGERHHDRPPPQPERRAMTALEIVAATKKARSPT